MKNYKDEFNVVKITNEGENPSLEFGFTQDEESTSYGENRNHFRDEVNDNDVNNSDNKNNKKKKDNKKDNKNTPQTKMTSIATVIGASLIVVPTLSVLIGINLFYNAKCNNVSLEATPVSINYDLELSDIANNKCLISIENKEAEYYAAQELKEGRNEGVFEDLKPITQYHLTVIDTTYNNYILYEENVSTLEDGVYYTITFDTQGGTPVESQKVKEGEIVTKPEDPTYDGYDFIEWQLDGETYDFSTPVHEDLTLIALWSEHVNSYTVTFDSNGGTPVESQKVKEGETVAKPRDPTYEGYDFVEWQLDGETYDFSLPVHNSFTLIALWSEHVNSYTITFDSNGGTEIPSQTVVDGETVSKPDDPTYDGYDFIEWQLDGETYDFSLPVHNSFTLIATWEEHANSYTVTFDSDGGTEIPSQTVEDGQTATKPEVDPVKEDATFLYWSILDGDEYVEYDFSTPVTDDITLLAIYSVVQPLEVVSISDEIDVSKTTHEITINLLFNKDLSLFSDIQIKFSHVTFRGYPSVEFTTDLQAVAGEQTITLTDTTKCDFARLQDFDYKITYTMSEETKTGPTGKITFQDADGDGVVLDYFYLAYYDTVATVATQSLFFKYNNVDTIGDLSNYHLMIKNIETYLTAIDRDIDIPSLGEGYLTITPQESDPSEFNFESGTYFYTLSATSSRLGESFDLVSGTFDSATISLNPIGEVSFQNEYFSIDNQEYIIANFDYNGRDDSTSLEFEYTIPGHNSETQSIDAVRGQKLIPVNFYGQDNVTMTYTIRGVTGNELASGQETLTKTTDESIRFFGGHFATHLVDTNKNQLKIVVYHNDIDHTQIKDTFLRIDDGSYEYKIKFDMSQVSSLEEVITIQMTAAQYNFYTAIITSALKIELVGTVNDNEISNLISNNECFSVRLY